ncbi:MAG: 3'-5' exonuclease [Verrucomicrobia bacterium]|nr:3'-5' exonuclease [Verrucomicrobiota bacterium]
MLGVFLDTETNGLNAYRHRVLEIAFKIIDLRTGELKEAYEAILHQSNDEWKRSDPASLKVNGFTHEQTIRGKKADIVAAEITNILQRNKIRRGEAVFICQNPSFDRIFFSQLVDPDVQENLQWPYYWLDLASMYWAESIRKGKENPQHFPWVTGFSKDRIAAVYHLPGEQHPHRAMNGVDHLLLCYEKVIGFGC